jgi:hypothetical protein
MGYGWAFAVAVALLVVGALLALRGIAPTASLRPGHVARHVPAPLER